jgi:hypothetical protein
MCPGKLRSISATKSTIQPPLLLPPPPLLLLIMPPLLLLLLPPPPPPPLLLLLLLAQVVRELSKESNLRTAVLVGGDAMEAQFAELAHNPDIIVATPGNFSRKGMFEK